MLSVIDAHIALVRLGFSTCLKTKKREEKKKGKEKREKKQNAIFRPNFSG